MDEAAQVIRLLTEKHQTLATAESCTGGLLGKLLTDVPGASAAYLGGVISYAYAVKEKLLGVPRDVLDSKGAVSEECAKAMAEGIMKAAGSDFGVSTTGIAGPTGGTAEKPVGTVYIGVADKTGAFARKYVFKTEGCPDFLSERDFIRLQAVNQALLLLKKQIEKSK